MSLATYTSKTWTDYADSPCLEAVELNRIDSGIAAVTAELLALEAALPTTYQPISAELSALAALSSTGYAKRTGAAAWSVVSSIPQADVSGLTAALAGRQPLDADLTAISALATTGFVRRTAADTWAASTLVWSDISSGHPSVIAGTGLSGTGSIASNVTLSVAYGTAAGTACVGNDSRVLNGQTAYSWGNHAAAGYLTAASSLDPAKVAQTASYRFVTDAEKVVWNAKQAGSSVLTSIAAQSSGTGLLKLTSGVASLDSSVYALASSIPLASSTAPSALGTAAVGTGATWARADHVHAMPTAAQVGALGLTSQAADSTKLGGQLPSYYASVASLSGYQPLDSDLTAIAALTTQTFGRSLLTAVDAAAGRALLGAQAAGSYESAIAGSDITTFWRGDKTWSNAIYATFYSGGPSSGFQSYNGGGVAEWYMGQNGTTQHGWQLNKFASGVHTTYLSMSTDGVATFANRPVFGSATPWDSNNLVGTRNEHNHAGTYLPLAGGTMGGDINLGGYSITSGSTGLGNGMVSSIGGNFTNLQVLTLMAASGFTKINLSNNLIPSTDSGVNLGQLDKRLLASYSVYSYLSYLDASAEVAGPVMRWKNRIVIGSGGVLPIVGDGCAIIAVGQGTGSLTNKPTTNNYQAVDYRKADGTLATAAAGGNVIDLDLYGRCAFIVGVSSSQAQLIL